MWYKLLSRKAFDMHKFESFRACINETKTKNSNYLYGHYYVQEEVRSLEIQSCFAEDSILSFLHNRSLSQLASVFMPRALTPD